MKVVDALIFTPVAAALFIGVELWRRGQTAQDDMAASATLTSMNTAPIDPWLGIAMIGLLTLSGAVLLVRELFAEPRDAKRLDTQKRKPRD